VLLGILLFGGRHIAGLLPQFTLWVRDLGWAGPIVFMAGYLVAELLLVPASLLTLAAGALFGVAPGTVYVLISATVGAGIAFLLARHSLRRRVEGWMRGNPRFAAIDEAIAREGWKIVFLLRLSPAFPFVILNYALGLTRIRFVDYLWASVGMIPGTLLYTYSGRVVGDLATLTAGRTSPHGLGYYLVVALGLLATVAVTMLVTRLARRALINATEGALA
jgi:uncharacterized membrane protein YdjX (TVP38/TMEM64 family)